MGARGPQAKMGRPKKTADYTRIDFDNPMSENEKEVLAKLQAMKPRERVEYLAALWAEDQQRQLGRAMG
mgnify:CR=1 FL=1